ncbi:hypothetical protein AVEN_9415-1 [Araneus ventricosus]|uniref:RNase H type-1 domain-containing protein n=1 Tax=Araneus ventricosus TaxID=182803 RepID=A0A4Y2DLG0_ARAVE|nr:hypothetical protein AVEN_9415-1 [Araneus ventricosus]
MLNTSNPTHTSYTGTSSLLYLTLCSTSIYHQVDCFVSDSTPESDHNPVVITWSLLGQFSKTIKTIDWNSFMTHFSEILSSTNSDLHTVMRKVSVIIKNNTKHTVLPVANDTHSPLFRQSSNPCIQLNREDQEDCAGLFTDLNITFDQTITLPNILDVLHNDICEIHLTSFGFQDKAQPTSMIKALFEETISEEFQDYFIIATDASKSQFYTSIVGTSNLRSFSFRIHPINSIFTAEALAICQAIDDLSVPDSNLLILTDSFSVLQALKNLTIKSPKVILRLTHKILMRVKLNKKNIALIWTPGHSSITWNERADSLTKNVTESDLYIEWIAMEDFVHTIVNFLFKHRLKTFEIANI